VVQVQSSRGLQLRPWQPLNQQASDFRARFAGIAGGALAAGPKPEYEAVGYIPRCEWLCQADAKGLISQEGPPGLRSAARPRQVT
jgi:hypothetical protein